MSAQTQQSGSIPPDDTWVGTKPYLAYSRPIEYGVRVIGEKKVLTPDPGSRWTI